MIIVNLFNDPTQNGIINQRLVTHVINVLRYTDLNKEENKDITDILYYIGMKLVAVWRHLENYKAIEDRLIKKAQNSASIEKQAIKHIRYEQDLFLELDEFLVQLKSSLDHLVKIPRAIVGKKVWTLATFHKKGEAVIGALKGSLPAKYKDKAKLIEDMVVQKHLDWLADTINARDMINHYLHGGLDIQGFMVLKIVENGKEKIHVPMRTEDLALRAYMEIAWANLFKLTEDFIIGFLALRLTEGYSLLHTKVDRTSVKSPWKVMTTADYEKLIATKDWENQVSSIQCLTDYRTVLTNELVSEKRTIIIAIPCKDGLVICADKKLNMSVGGSIIEDAVKVYRLSSHIAFGVIGGSIFYDPLNPSKILYSAEEVIKSYFANKKYVSDDWSDFARTLTQSFGDFGQKLSSSYIILGDLPPDRCIFRIVFWYLRSDGTFGTYTFGLHYIREIRQLYPLGMKAPAETFETGRASVWGNVRLIDEIKIGSDSRFDELRNDSDVRRFLIEEPPASEVTMEEAVAVANKIIKLSKTMTWELDPIKEAAEIEDKTDCAIIHHQTGFKWLSEQKVVSPKIASPTLKPIKKKKKKRK